MHSQSLLVPGTSLTHWFPYVNSVTADSSTLECLNAHYRTVNRAVANLSPPQSSSLFAATSPHVFFPHIGIFSSDFAISTAILHHKK